jgi:hypothetical protein
MGRGYLKRLDSRFHGNDKYGLKNSFSAVCYSSGKHITNVMPDLIRHPCFQITGFLLSQEWHQESKKDNLREITNQGKSTFDKSVNIEERER